MITFFSRSRTKSKTPNAPTRRGYLKGSLIAIFAVGLLTATFVAGILSFPTLKAGFNHITLTMGITWKNKRAVAAALNDSLLSAPGNYIRAVSNKGNVPTLRIDIKFKHYEKLRRQRETALARGFLDTGGEDFVPASIRYQDQDVRVRLRLKGDLPDHYNSERWSFRIKVRGDNHLFGMRRFSVQHPKVRRYHREPLYLDHLRREGVLAPRYFFVRAIVNGKDVGLMALEEHFSKELLESQQRREGVIVKFNGDNYWWSWFNASSLYNDFMINDVEIYQGGRTQRIPRLKKQRDKALGLMRSFLEGHLAVSAVFDSELMARFLVVNKLWNAEHTTVLDNLRLYLNPVTMLMEPIGFDGVPLLDAHEPSISPPEGVLYDRLFDDPDFRNVYFAAAKRIGREAQSDAFVQWVDQREGKYLRVLHRENPLIPRFLSQIVARHGSAIAQFNEEILAAKNADRALVVSGIRFPQVIKAYVVADEENHFLELRNVMPLKVTVTDIAILGQEEKAPHALFPTQNLPIVFPARTGKQTGRVVRLNLAGTDIKADQKIVVTAQVSGYEENYKETAIPYADLVTKPILPPALSIAETLRAHPFLEWQGETQSFNARAGDWRVSGDIIVPDGAGLVLNPGTRLRFEPGAILLARGPLSFEGSAENPVSLQGDDPNKGWGGIAVLDSKAPSRFSHVTLNNMKGIARDGWLLSGGVTFRRSFVDISDTLFSDIEAEDALNVIRSKFALKRTSFRSTRSDAVDSDFSSGNITGGYYSDIGGDGIDVSGTELVVEEAVLERVNDKGLSIGEASNARINNISVSGAGTGIASKDGSQTTVNGATFTNILHAALMAYTKKPSYGPGKLVAENMTMQNVGEEAVVQTGSTIVVDRISIEPRDMDIDALYSQGYMKK